MENEIRLIDANDITYEVAYLPTTQGYEKVWAVTELGIEQAPTIDPGSMRPKGRWEKNHTSRYGAPAYFCSCCFDIWESVQIKNMKYCPSCGAKMEVEGCTEK